jgi:hypothetical protein
MKVENKKNITLKHNNEVYFEDEVINEAPSSGAFDDYADYLLDCVYNVETTLEDTIKILEPFGAWENEDLQDLEDNIKRILWIGILYCKEEKTNWCYLGE